MELSAGDITKKRWIMWNVTLEEGIKWCRYNIRRRYEWLEIIGKALESGNEKEKKCRHPQVCNMCRKYCLQRLAEFQLH
jgi:hypothetical protein